MCWLLAYTYVPPFRCFIKQRASLCHQQPSMAKVGSKEMCTAVRLHSFRVPHMWVPSLFCSFLCLLTFNPLSTIIRAIGYFETDTNFAEVNSAAVGNKVLGCTQRYAHMYARSTSVFRIQERQILEIEFTTPTSGGINIKKRRILLRACYHRC